MRPRIAFFDFDGTITSSDTLLEFIKFCKGKKNFYLGFLYNIWFLLGYKAGLISNQAAKEKVLQHFFRGVPLEQFNQWCSRFAAEALPRLIRPGALEEISKLRSEGFTIVIVSASPENWIAPWAQKMDSRLLASRLEVNNGFITGRLTGKNCHGNEKVSRIREAYALDQYDEIYAYGDTSGDRPMLKLATKGFYRPFR